MARWSTIPPGADIALGTWLEQFKRCVGHRAQLLSLTAIVHAYSQRERMRRGAGLTFPAVRAIVQEIFTTLLFVAKPSYLHWIEQAKNANFNYGSDQVGLEKHLSGLDLMFMAGSITRFFARVCRAGLGAHVPARPYRHPRPSGRPQAT